MKKKYYIPAALVLAVLLAVCFPKATDRENVMDVYNSNESAFAEAAASGDFATLDGIKGVQEVETSGQNGFADIKFGGRGFGPSTRYYGIFYSAEDNLCAVEVASPQDKLAACEQGFLYQQEDGDNRYYVEPLGNHFYYYEAQF